MICLAHETFKKSQNPSWLALTVAGASIDMTHAYYDSISTAYTPAIYHGQDSGHGGRCGLCLNACSTPMWDP